MISWKTSRSEAELITKIAQRAVAMAASAGVDYEYRLAEMDLTATHCNGCALRLVELLAAGDYDFSHDIFGIRRHIDRETGELPGWFAPRFSV